MPGKERLMYKKLHSLYCATKVESLEQVLMNDNVVSLKELLHRAGAIAWQTLYAHWPNCEQITICCGCGKNAGDGFVLAQLAKKQGLQVRVWAIEDLANLLPEVANEAAACQAAGIKIEPYQGQSELSCDVIVDALLGTGLNRNLDGRYLQLVQAINAAQAPVMSLDVPTGINANSGKILGAAVKAEMTLCFLLPKIGLFTDSGLSHAGRVLCDDLGIEQKHIELVAADASLLVSNMMKNLLAPRERHTHKGHYGHVLVIGGDYGMGGAVRMAAEAAMRVGSGLVSVATRPEHVNVVTTNRPEIMCYSVTSAEELKPLLDKATVIVIGPGLGKSTWSRELFAAVLECNKQLVIDADGLNLLSENPRQIKNAIFTPHPGEAKRLLIGALEQSEKSSADAIALTNSNDRFALARELQQYYSGVVILKGAGTIISPADGEIQSVCIAGNPGMATAGMGDVLSGVVGGLLAQGLTAAESAKLGVYAHALAGDMAAKKGGERGMLASDLFKYLRMLANPTPGSAQEDDK
jgi:hydroxyethylthiazole kinase-like uncharacterized protein yjeF